MSNKTIAVLTGGGPTSVINASLHGLLRDAQEHDLRVYGCEHGWQGLVEDRVCDLSAVIENHLWYKPSSELGSSRYDPMKNASDIARIQSVLRKHKITHLVPIGGDDTMRVAARLHQLFSGLHVIGIPKTIDNDLSHTDYAPGYPSVASFVADYVWRLRQDAQALRRVYVIEVMGRDSGFIAAAASGARGADSRDRADFILTPEMVIDYAKLQKDALERYAQNGNLLVVVAEGIRDQNGVQIVRGCPRDVRDAFDHPHLEGAGAYVAQHLSGMPVHSERIGAYQRVVKASRLDRENAELLGKKCIELIIDGKASGHMLTLVREELHSLHPPRWNISSVPLEEVTQRRLSSEDLDGYMVSDHFNAYLAPFMLHGRPREDYLHIPRTRPSCQEEHVPTGRRV